MKETTITATELARSLSDILNRVKYQGEVFVVQRNGEPIATLTPAPPRPMTLAEFFRYMDTIPRPDDQFADDLAKIHENQPPVEIRDWPS